MSELVNVTQTAAALTKIFGAEKYYHYYYYYYSEIFISKCFLPSYCPPAALVKRRPDPPQRPRPLAPSFAPRPSVQRYPVARASHNGIAESLSPLTLRSNAACHYYFVFHWRTKRGRIDMRKKTGWVGGTLRSQTRKCIEGERSGIRKVEESQITRRHIQREISFNT